MKIFELGEARYLRYQKKTLRSLRFPCDNKWILTFDMMMIPPLSLDNHHLSHLILWNNQSWALI